MSALWRSGKAREIFSRLDTESLWILMGTACSLVYFTALADARTPFLLGLSAMLLVSVMLFLRSTPNVMGFSASLVVALWVIGKQPLGWDAASFELQGYYDWRNGLRGAYWDYSKLPSMLFGFGYAVGRDAYRLVYALQIVLLALGLSHVTVGKRNGLFFLIVTWMMINVLPQLFEHGKGDVMVLSFSLVALAFAPIREDHPHLARHWIIFLLFSSLAIAAKLSAVIAMLPLFLASLWLGKPIECLRKAGFWIISAVVVALGNFSTFFYNLFHYGSVLDFESARLGKGFSLINHLPDLLKGALNFPPNPLAATILLVGLLGLESLFFRKHPIQVRIRNATLIASLLLNPLVMLFDFRASTNLRLIAFPLLGILAINVWRPRENATS